MQATLTITRYRRMLIPIGFLAMAIFRFPLLLRRDISFYKLMGSGKNGTFDKTPDLQQWAILTVHSSPARASIDNNISRVILGGFISRWLHFFNCETFTILLTPLEGHGTWDGKKVFGEYAAGNPHSGPVAILTRATIRISKLTVFWKNVPSVARKMREAKGLIASFGIGEIPWIKQATFSVWEGLDDMKAFAYHMQEHKDVIKKTRSGDWYREEMFFRFKIDGCHGTLKGIDPLATLKVSR